MKTNQPQQFANQNPQALIGTNQIPLLEPTGYFNVDRYPWAYACWKKQQQVHWLGEEVPLAADVKDWQHLPENELTLLTEILRFFTQSDVEVSDNYIKRYMPIFQPLEIQMMMAAFSNMETVHIDAYSLLLTTLGMPKSEFHAFRQYTQMQGKIDYMHRFGVKTCADVSRTLAMFGAFTEGMSLFASFAMLLNFPRHNKMKGLRQIVSWSVRDESLHCEGMVHLFHAWNKETGCLTPVVINDIIDIAKDMVKLEDAFIDLAFQLGDVEGMAANDIKSYIRYICDWRLIQLKINPLFGYFELHTDGTYKQLKQHPLPWLLNILNGVEHANFFEVRATEYSKASTTGVWGGEQGVWSRFDNSLKNTL